MPVAIRRCEPSDIDATVRFIDEHWQRGHALVASRPLLDWQYRNPDGTYSFVIAQSEDEIVGLLGYIATSRYDASLVGNRVLWLTTWKVREDAHVSGLGIALLQYLGSTERHTAIGTVGFQSSVEPIYRRLGFHVGTLEHYVMPNPARRSFELATLSDTVIRTPQDDACAVTATLVTDPSAFDALLTERPLWSHVVPRKTPRYFYQRFVAHPFYAYRVLLLNDSSNVLGLLAVRTAEHDGRRAVRIVDFLGSAEAFGRCGPVVRQLIEEQGAEYADVYNTGFDRATFARAGFRRVDEAAGEIVPDHFEPFERRNVQLRFSFRNGHGPTLFKADGDQDRPNRIGTRTCR